MLLSNFKLVSEILTENQKYSKEKQGVNIDQIAMCYISMDLSQRALQNNGTLFSNFKLVFEILAENQKIFKRIVRPEHWSKCNVPIMYQWISLDKLYKLMESFFSNFGIMFRISYNFFI